MKKYITWLLTIAMVLTIIPSNLFIAHGAPTTVQQYAYIVMGGRLYVEKRAGGRLWTEGTWGPGGERVLGSDGNYTTDVEVEVNAPGTMNLSGTKWTNESFRCSEVYRRNNISPKSNRFYTGSIGGAPQYTNLDDAANRIIGSNTEKYFSSMGGLRINPDGNSVTFDAQIQFSKAEYDRMSTGTRYIYEVIMILEYTSLKELPNDEFSEGEPEPPEPPVPPKVPSIPRLHARLEAEAAYVNYKNYSGNVNATATITDTSNYGDIDFLQDYTITLNAFGEKSSSTSREQLGTTSTSLKGAITKGAPWLSDKEVGRTLKYTASMDANLRLQSGNAANAKRSVEAVLVLTNEMPAAIFSLKSDNFNGNPVAENSYYVGVPAKLKATFKDAENDQKEVQLAIGLKANMEASPPKAQFVYYNTSAGGEQHMASPDTLRVTNVVMGLSGYEATVEFLRPGTYKYTIFVVDSATNKALEQADAGEGTFVVKEAPKAPQAVINSPAFAFDGESLTVTQASTDENGVDDIVYYKWTDALDVTQEYDSVLASDPKFKPITNVVNNWPGNGTVNGKNGGTLTFPAGSAHHYFRIRLDITDSTGLKGHAEQVIKVTSKAPAASLISDKKDNSLKENRKIVLSADGSTANSTDPILWNETEWKIEAVSGGTAANIHEDTTQRNGNKQRVLQFSKPGVYKATLKLVNNFSKNNPTHPDLAASTVSILITVVEDKAPTSSLVITSGKPDSITNASFPVKFRVSSSSPDGDILNAASYVWTIYTDKNNDGVFSADEKVAPGDIKFNAEKTEAEIQSKFEAGKSTKIRAEVTTTEAFKEEFIAKLLPADGSYVRSKTVSLDTSLNWAPSIEVLPDSNKDTPYEDTDVDGDGITDGKYIRAYTDDTFSLSTKINDEFPAKCRVTWELYKKEHDGTFHSSSGGTPWLSNSNITSSLKSSGGTLRIDLPGVYMLKAIVKDDQGETSEGTVMIRIYTLPQAVLESNPNYQINNRDPWYTKENIRFDLRSNPTIVDDEWGKAWHTINWELDNWDVKPLSGQNTNEIHFMDPQYKGRYNNTTPGDATKFGGRNSPLGFGVVVDRPIDIVVMPGLLGDPRADNPLQLDDIEKQELYAAADELAAKLAAKDKRYNTKVYKTWAAQDTSDLFRTPEMYGFFDPFTNTGDDERNLYTHSYHSEINEEATNTGFNTVIADLDKMTRDNCKFGVMDLMTAYEETHPDMAGKEFTGSAKVYVNGVLISDCPNKSKWENVAKLDALPDGSWKITGNLGNSVTCRGNTEIKTTFTGGALWTSVATRGWGGIYKDEYKMVTHEKSMLETLKALNLRSNSTKIIVYAANKYTDTTEFRPDTNVLTDGKCQALKDYLNANSMHFMSVIPYDMSKQMNDFYSQLKIGGVASGLWVPYGSSTPEFMGTTLYDYIISKAKLTNNTQYRSCSFTAPGKYSITYWGTNFGGKVTKPVTYNITVEPDMAPIIVGSMAERVLRDPSSLLKNKPSATLSITGGNVSGIQRDKLTITSPDGDYIDKVEADVIWDANNNKIFDDKVTHLKESDWTTIGDLYYILKRVS